MPHDTDAIRGELSRLATLPDEDIDLAEAALAWPPSSGRGGRVTAIAASWTHWRRRLRDKPARAAPSRTASPP